jgi:hypothetical protein
MGSKTAMNYAEKLTDREKAGIRAILYLRKLAGVEETEEKALEGWKKMSAVERLRTMTMYEVFHDAIEGRR